MCVRTVFTLSSQCVSVSRPPNGPDAGKPWFRVLARWMECEPVTDAVMVDKTPKAGLYQLVQTRILQFEFIDGRRWECTWNMVAKRLAKTDWLSMQTNIGFHFNVLQGPVGSFSCVAAKMYVRGSDGQDL